MSTCGYRLAAIVAASALVAGCTAAPRVAEVPATSAQVPVADMLDGARGDRLLPGGATRQEIVRMFAQRYPPAQTRLAVRGPLDDSLGRALVASLRERGYAVEEIAPRSGRASAGLPLAYRFARIEGDPERYALSVSVGPTQLSRIYVRGNDGRVILPGGAWSLRE